jgi:iron complex transport system permease protein
VTAASLVRPSIARRRVRFAIVPVLALLLALAFLLHVALGPVIIPPIGIVAALLDAVGLHTGVELSEQHRAIVTAIRLPRACLALLVGMALGQAGALLQGLFRNPLAEPTLVGVSSGAALAAASVIVFAGVIAGKAAATVLPFLLPMAAFAGGLLATLLIYRIGTRHGAASIPLMLLAGIAVNAIAFSLIGMLIYASDDRQLRDISYWMLGSLGGARWVGVFVLAPLALLPLLLGGRLARALNALMLGEREAGHLGIDVEWVKRLATVGVAIAVGGAVAFSGIISFVGLVVPHLVRLMAGPDHRVVLPASALLGAALLLAADLVARTAVAPTELPVGLVTSLIGAPFFIWLLLSRGQRSET